MTQNIDWKQWLRLDPLSSHFPPTEEAEQKRLRYLKSLIGAIVFMVIGVVLTGIIAALVVIGSGSDINSIWSGQEGLLYTGLSLIFGFGLPALATSAGREALGTLRLRLAAPLDHPKQLWGFILGLLVAALLSSSVLNLFSEWSFELTGLDQIFQLKDPVSQQVEALIAGAGAEIYPMLLFSICICPAVAEELFFRGVIDRALEYQLPSRPWLSLFISATVFSLLHLSAVGFLGRLAVGMLLGYSYRKTNRIYIPMLLHFLNNLLALGALSS